MTGLLPLKRKLDNPIESEHKKSAFLVLAEQEQQATYGQPMLSVDDGVVHDDDGSENSGEFVDAQEQLPSSFIALDESHDDNFFSQMLLCAEQNPLENNENGNGSHDEYHNAFNITSTEEVAEDGIGQATEPAPTEEAESSSEEEADLFASTFGKSGAKFNKSNDADHSDKESDVEITSVKKTAPAARRSLPPNCKADKPQSLMTDLFLDTIHAQGYNLGACEHADGCTCGSIRRMSKPPSPPSTYQPVSVPKLPESLSPALEAYRRLHTRAKLAIPELSSGDRFDWTRRYWIAVLLQGRKWQKAGNTRDFVWMKGNKFSTVATVWHSYQTTTMADPDELVLLLGRERVEMAAQAQELDHFSDKLVVFRAVRASDADAQGRALTEGLVPEVIELD